MANGKGGSEGGGAGAGRVEELRQEAPGIVELARAVSLAVRVEPVLLRVARLYLTRQHLDAGVESDLWFSPLVESRSAGAIVLDSRVLGELRQELKDADRAWLARAHALVERVHAREDPAIRLEEEVIWLSVQSGPGVEAAVNAALRKAVKAMVENPERGLAVARWADRALMSLPGLALGTEAGRLLAVGAISRLGDHSQTARAGRVAGGAQGSEWVVPKAVLDRPADIGLRMALSGGLVELTASDRSGSTRLPLRVGEAALLDLAWTDLNGQEWEQSIAPTSGTVVRLSEGCRVATLRTSSGAEYRLEADPSARFGLLIAPEVERVVATFEESERSRWNEILLSLVQGSPEKAELRDSEDKLEGGVRRGRRTLRYVRPPLAVRYFLDESWGAPVVTVLAVERDDGQPPSEPAVFVSYSHKDKVWAQRLKEILESQGTAVWLVMQTVRAGEDWLSEIETALVRARVAVVLVSADYLASSYCQQEWRLIERRAEKGSLRVAPIALSPAGFLQTAISRFQFLNEPSAPLSSLGAEDSKAELDRIASRIRMILHGETPHPDVDETKSEPSERASQTQTPRSRGERMPVSPRVRAGGRQSPRVKIQDEAAMREAADALFKALAKSGCEGARDEMPRLLAALRAPINGDLVRDVLDKLRRLRCYVPMQVFAAAAAKIADGRLLRYVKRQLAQARIELGLLGEAATLLEGLVKEVEHAGTGRERSEVTGLLGRVYKQRFVQAVAGGATGEEELRAAVRAYAEVFDLDPAWHGANIVALAARAERDGISIDTDSAKTWALRLLSELEERDRTRWSPWDHAAAGEAYLALGDRDGVADSFARYWDSPGVDAFALAGTERQLREIWQIAPGDADELRSSLLLHLEARQLTAAQGGARYTADGLQQLTTRLRAAAGQAGPTFGAGSAIPVDRLLRLFDRAKSVCRIANSTDPDKAGTGFLVNGPDLSPSLDGVYVLTNHTVLHGDEATDALLARPEYAGSIDVAQALAEFHFWDGIPRKHAIKLQKVVRYSPRSEADFALASLSEAIPAGLGLPLCREPKPLGSRNVVDPRQRAKVIIVGHPKGGDLAFDVSDNEVVDHELDDKSYGHPRRIHYRIRTEPGSGGSPVFHHKSLEVVGLHRTGGALPLRDDWVRASDDEIYEANEAVAIRSLLEILK